MSLDEFCDAVMWMVILLGAMLGLVVLAVVLVLGTFGRFIIAFARMARRAWR